MTVHPTWKPTMHAPKITLPVRSAARITAGLALASLLGACGLKGALYMPPPPPPPSATLTEPPNTGAATGNATAKQPANTAPASTSPVK